MFERFMSDARIQKKYVRIGTIVGEMLSYSFMGEAVGFMGYLDEFDRLEKIYVSRGYRTVSIDEFIQLGGYDKVLEGFGVKRKAHETPIFHVEIFRRKYLRGNKLALVVDGVSNEDGSFQGTYEAPTTEDE